MENLPNADQIFFLRSFNKFHKIPILYEPPKLHKKQNPNYIKTRPVVAKIKSFIEIA